MSNPFGQSDLFDNWNDDVADSTKATIENTEKQGENTNASTVQTKPVSFRDTEATQEGSAPDNRDSEPVGTGLAGIGDGANTNGAVSGRADESGAAGTRSVEPAGQQSSGETRDSSGVRSESSASGSDFVIDVDDIGKGGLAKKYKDNIAAIRIIKAMEAEGRFASPEERKQIAKYVGWGAIKGVFDPENKQWGKQHAELKELLTDAEFKAARKSTLDAHYTGSIVVGAMYDAMQHLGFTGGRVLESSVGIGNFFGMMPSAMRNASQLHGVELDSLTSRLVAALYPEAKIAQATGFEDFQIPAEYFDAVIGNTPFGNQPLVDTERSPYSGFSIHNYFLAKSIDKLRPGGIMQVVVSHNFLDANDDRTRQWIWERAALIGAVRLPNTAFKENAGTEIVTDILIFQKRDKNGLPNDISAWRDVVDQNNTNPKTGDTVTHKVNQFFTENPQLVLGSPSAGGNMYTANEYTVEATGDIKAQLAGWVTSLPQNIYDYIDRQADSAIEDLAMPEAIKVGSFYMNATGKVMQRRDDVMGNKTANEWVPPNEKAVARMQGMIALRDSLRTQMRIERLGQDTETGIEANRAKLNRLYDTFLKQHGHINNQTNRRLFLDDTEAQLLQALEFDYDKGISKAVAEKEGIDQREPSAVKADIFKRRVAFPPQDFMTVTTAKDALLASLNYRGRVDGTYMAEVYDKSVEDIIKELGDVVFDDPQTGIVTADDYLSGDVKTKLAVAIAAVQDNANYKRNVAALEKIIPLDKKPSEISVSIGAAFIPDDMYCQFIKHISGGDSTLTYIKTTGQWLINFSGQADPALNTGKFGTSDLSAQELLHLSMLGRGAVVKKTTRNADGSTTTVLLEKETEAAREKQNAIKDEWKKWLWNDAERADKIATIYNDKMNRIVARQFDGSHLTFPGMNPAINLLEHQKNGVWRGLQSYQVLYDHVVGAGKTFEMATLAMEMRRLGIARKPLFVVPNHLTLQWRSEFTRLYPGSNILAATPEDFSKDNRERLFSKIITGDWDAVVVGHSSLKRIGLPEATEKAVLQEQLDEIGDAIELMKRERGDRNIIRDMEGIRSRLEAKMKDKLASIGKRSKVVTFDELGIDALFVDEMHEFKNLSYNSTMDRNPGMGNPNGSAKAFDMFVKTRWLFDTFGDKTPFITATGTPVSNSLVEMYNMQRYMQYPLLKQEGLHVFDAWAKQFGSVENVYEVAPSGSGYRQSTRFAKFTNLPALMGLYNLFADTITLDDLKAQEESQGKRFPVPKLVGGKPVLVVAKRSPQVSSRMGVPTADTDADGNIKFLADLSNEVSISKNEESGKFVAKVGDHVLGHLDTEEDARLKIVEMALTPSVNVHPESILGRFGRLRELTRATKGKVNALSLTGEANKVGLDYRLIEPDAPDFAGSKINMAVANMINVYHQWGSDKGTQLVFCDMSIPLSARSSYSSKDRRVYIRDDAGDIDMKRGTLHTLDGHEDLPYFIVQRGEKDAKRFDVYDAASGVWVVKDSRTRQEAKDSANRLLLADDPRQDWIDKREIAREIEQAHIDEYNNEHDVETEGLEFYTREDIAGVSGSTKFSVYDDIKAKLMGKGIPEREIAFIHDYSTPTAKDKLFKAINAGEVRFTLGSTQKMGAGTNVQKLLVGLHHIDAPWRPSDLEQREGRIIRRGNALYARDPENFAVFIGRYATEQTYDTRRWQILEHKARGIEQLRKYDGTLNEIDDIEGEAANAADMKAAASGDPLILEETKCRNTVRRLEQLQAGHADEVLVMTRKARDAQEYADGYGPRYLARIKALIATANQYPLDKHGFSPVTVDGQLIVERDKAQEGIAGAVGRLRANKAESTTLLYRGLEFTIERHIGYISVDSLTGDTSSWSDNEAFSASGFIQRLANGIGRLPDIVESTQARIEKSARDAVAMREQAKQPFQQADELEATREKYKAIQRVLLVKGPTVPESQKAAVAKGIAAQKVKLAALGFGDALQEFFGDSNGHQLNESDTLLSHIPENSHTEFREPSQQASVAKSGGQVISVNFQERPMTHKKPFHETVAEKLIEQLKSGTAPWQRPWLPGEAGAFVPTNPITGKRYRGINAIHMMSQDYRDQRWLTYKQAVSVEAQVRKGEKGTPIQYWKFSEEYIKKDADGKPILDAQGEPLKFVVKLERPRVFFATVFNAEQVDGMPPVQPRKAQEWNAVERAEHILQASGAVIRNGEQNRAFYRPSTDSIHLPDKGQFPSADNYYATALHELGHWTGHESRLARDLVHPFGSEGYAKEELRAEIASMILGDELGIGHNPEQHAAYVGSWINALQDDPLEIFRAAADAEKIQDYVLGLEQQVQEQAQIQEQNQEQPQEQTPTPPLQEAEMNSETNENDTSSTVDKILAAKKSDRQTSTLEVDPQQQAQQEQQEQQEPMVVPRPAAHLLTRDEFAKIATARLLENHGRRWEVFIGEQSFGFSDAETAIGAVQEAHKREVNNALYSRSTENTGVIDIKELPPEHVLNEYPDLQAIFADTVNFNQPESHAENQALTDVLPEKTFINVPFKEKDEAKALGAQWDRQAQSWVVPAGLDPVPFAKWAKSTAIASVAVDEPKADQVTPKPSPDRQYLAVPYGEHVAAKAAGALWDKAAKSWYIGPKADTAKLERWAADRVLNQQGPAMTPEEEFAEALRSLGCVVEGKHPVMDGTKQRIAVEGDKKSEQAGFYVGHLDGHPAGYIKNNKTGIEMKWKSKGYALDPEQKAQLNAEAAAKLQARDTEQARLHEYTAQRVSAQMADLVPVEQPTPYMQAKGIEPQAGVFTDKDGQKTYIPATDVDGKQWTMQYIKEDGTKRFAKDSRKEGCFHVIGGMAALAKAPVLVISEGYATAASLSQALGFATVAAFDSGNLPLVAKALREKFPDKPVVIAGDDDEHLEATQGVNPGRSKAEEAAKAVGGKVLLPIFAPGEQAANPKRFTDFNDLANNSVLGKEGIERQVCSIVDAVIEKHQARIEQQQEYIQKKEQRPRRAVKNG